MKSSDYLEKVTFAQDRYLGYIYHNEPQLFEECGVDMSLQALEDAKMELKKRGYRFFVSSDGIADERLFAISLKMCMAKGNPQLIYFDEDVAEGLTTDDISSISVEDFFSARKKPFFKPDFSPDTLEAFFYIGGAFLLGKDLCDDLELTDDNFEVALNAAMRTAVAEAVLNCFYSERFTSVHIPLVLYHTWELPSYDYAEPLMPDYIRKADSDFKQNTSISAVILSKDNVKMLQECIASMQRYSCMPMEYIVVDNGSTEANRRFLEDELSKIGVKYIYQPMKFIYSALCNIGARAASGEFILFLNDDIILPEGTKDFPARLIRQAAKPHVGAAGVKLLYPVTETGEQLIQHAGVTLLKPGPSHKMATHSDSVCHERGRNRHIWNVLAVTGACLMVEKSKFDSVGGFDERLEIAYTDVDLCLDLLEKGYLSVTDNEIFLYHYESVSRGSDIIDEAKLNRLRRERKTFYEKHSWLLKSGDPYYNSNLNDRMLEYEPAYYYDWEEEVLSESMDCHLKQLPDGKIMGSVDSVILKTETGENQESCYEIEGWSFMHGKDGKSCDPVIVLMNEGGQLKTFRAQRKYRKELGEVFSQEKDVLMSGFVCRISAKDSFLTNGKCRVCVGIVKSGFIRGQIGFYKVSEKEI